MKTLNSYSVGNIGAQRQKCTRDRTNRLRRAIPKQEYEESCFSTQISRMEHTFRAQAESSRLQFYKHQAAWWKSQFVAAQFENRMLRQLLDKNYQMPTTSNLPRAFPSYNLQTFQPTSTSRRPETRPADQSTSEVQYEECEDSDDENEEFELSEEFKQFLDINRRHREQRDKEKARRRQERGSESDTERVERMEQVPMDDGEAKRREQLRQLYGERWRQVEGLETRVRLQHDRFCDTHQPPLWPNIPINL